MNIYKLFSFCMAILISNIINAELIVEKRFDETSESLNLNKKKTFYKIEDGVLKLNTAGKRLTMYPVIKDILLNDYLFSCKVRRTKKYPHDQHLGIILKGSDKRTLMIYTRGDRITYLEKKDKKVLKHTKLGSNFSKMWSIGKKSPWNDITISVRSSFVEIIVNKIRIGSFKCGLKVLREVNVYAYLIDAEFNDIILKNNSPKTSINITPKKSSKNIPDFYLSFDNDLNAITSSSEVIKPNTQRLINLTKGIIGKGVFVGRKKGMVTTKGGKKISLLPKLEYPAVNIFNKDEGTLMFWFKPNWDGKIINRTNYPVYTLFEGLSEKGKNFINIFMWYWLRVDLKYKDNLGRLSLRRVIRNAIKKGDWIHFAFSWNNNGWTKIFVNGKVTSKRISNLDFSLIKKFHLGFRNKPWGLYGNADAVFDEFKIYKRQLSNKEVINDYQKYMPVELILDNGTFLTDEKAQIELLVAPAGYDKKSQLEATPLKEVSIVLKVELKENETNKLIASKEFSLTLQNQEKILFDVGTLLQGEYRLQCHIISGSSSVQKTFSVIAYTPTKKATRTLKKTSAEVIFTKVMNKKALNTIVNEGPIKVLKSKLGQYIEGGIKNGDRFGFEIEFPKKYLTGKPVLLELEWPDDKPRSMAFYMYPEAKRKQHRDRLEGGVQTGKEYPLTNKLQKSSYIFYPGVKRYLFEVRTMIKGYPAGLATFTISTLPKGLLPAKINFPQNSKHRRIGHMDEDQTLEIILGYDGHKGKFRDPNIIEKICDYFSYTGQSIISYPILRYNYSYCRSSGYGSPYLLPRPPTGIGYFIKRLHRDNINFIGIVNFYTVPEISNNSENIKKYQEKGCFLYGKDGELFRGGKFNPGGRVNPVHPEVQRLYLQNIQKVLDRYGNIPGFTGIELWMFGKVNSFASFKEGYGDFTVGLFEKETGIKVPLSNNEDKFKIRYDFLTGEVKSKWLQWRAGKITALIQKVNTALIQTNPQLKLFLSVHISENSYEKYGIDFKALRRISNVNIVPMRSSNKYRWNLHWGRSSMINDDLFKRENFAPFLKNGSAYVNIYPPYFETFRSSMIPKIYKSYFQNADVKPFGRYFLKEFAFSLSAVDAQRLSIGAQPFGTWGRDTLTREFAKAYSALPQKTFKTAKGGKDPITVRYLQHKGKTYLYAVSLLWDKSSVKIKLQPNLEILDLSRNKILSSDDKGIIEIPLKAYQLRSFLIKGKSIARIISVNIPENIKTFYANKVKEIKIGIEELKKSTINLDKYIKRFNEIEKVFSTKRYFELHRLIFSELMNQVIKLNEVASKGYLKERKNMIANSQYAVNCGSGAYDYYRSKSGLLFFPDQAFSNGDYGYIAEQKIVVRDTNHIKNANDPNLFASEAYDIQAYKFKVKNGKYDVKVYFRVGYEPGAKPGRFVVNLDIENKRAIDNFDIFINSGSKVSGFVIKELKNISVNDGILDIKFSVPDKIDPTARLCNAIEIIPAK